MTNIFTKYRCCKGFLLLGAITILAGTVLDGLQLADIRIIGMVIFVAAAARLAIVPATKPHVDMYQAGYEAGYDCGHHEGHLQARPVVVPFPILHDISELKEHRNN